VHEERGSIGKNISGGEFYGRDKKRNVGGASAKEQTAKDPGEWWRCRLRLERKEKVKLRGGGRGVVDLPNRSSFVILIKKGRPFGCVEKGSRRKMEKIWGC